MSWLHLRHWGNLSAVCCPAWLTTTIKDYAPLFLFENSYFVTRKAREAWQGINSWVNGSVLLGTESVEREGSLRKAWHGASSSPGEPRISDSPIGSSIQIPFSKLHQDPVVLHRPLQGGRSHSSCAEGERKLQSHQPPKIMSLFGN